MSAAPASQRVQLSVETLTWLVGIYLALTCNGAFWRAALADRGADAVATWRFAFGTLLAMCVLNFLLLASVSCRRIVKPLLGTAVIAGAVAAYYQNRYAVILDPDMVRNVLHTQYREAREWISPRFLAEVAAVAAPPLLLLWRARIVRLECRRAAWFRVASLAVAIALGAAGLLLAFRDLSALMRNHKEVRYLVTPGNVVYATARVLGRDVGAARRPVVPIGIDARVVGRPAGGRPRLLVIVVGETARAQSWGLNGYVRDTTPELRALQPVNFSDVRACGTATEVSLPCMFAPVGRRNFDEARIRGQESLLHVLRHAGIASLWRDNQTGCKGVCTGLAFQQWRADDDPALCTGGLCYDEILLKHLRQEIDAQPGDFVVVLHPLGNHGPSYHRRHPPRFGVFAPACDSDDLGACTAEQIRNSYDNALRYADHFVAATIRLLQAQSGHDSALVYVSDHGESLGEHGLYLHGIPYAIAPTQQTAVPMIVWLDSGFASNAGIDIACLRRRSGLPLTHDYLFHSVLGLLDVRTRLYEPSLDFTAPCRARAGTTALQRAIIAAN
jgi:lipid A ethanolaminephosphotransferase